jgi:hypothetical protein
MPTVTSANGPRRGPFWAYLTLATVAVYPVSIVFGAYAVIEPLDLVPMARALGVSLGFALVLYVCLRAVVRDRSTRVGWLGVVLLLGYTYEIAVNTAKLFGYHVDLRDPRLAAAYTVGAMAIATVGVRPWRRVPPSLRPLLITAAVLVGANTYRGVARWWNEAPPTWVAAADALSYAAARDQNTAKAPARDIYYIILDGMGRADTLQSIYGLDAGPFVADLRATGFHVVDHARSNYAHTVLSFASFLNLDYLDSVAKAIGEQSGNREALEFLIQHNGLMRVAKRAGYQVVGIGTDYAATYTFAEADVCVCRQYGPSMFEQAVIDETPLAAAPLDPWTYGAHHTKVLAAFDALDPGVPSSRRQFVFAHILVPHPPFTFAADGALRRPDRPFSLVDGSEFEGSQDEYVRGYHDQAAFVMRRILSAVHAILGRPGPRPVIVIHADHGPGSRLQTNDEARSDLNERMNIFEAYYFPDGRDDLYDSITPVNLARTVANRYLGTTLPRLPDNSFFSTPSHPYDFVKVPPEAALGSGPRR